MAGFSLYVSNTTSKDQGYLCYKDQSGGSPSVDQNIPCFIYGRYVKYYNERNRNSYPIFLSTYAHNELCEVEVYGGYMQMLIYLIFVIVFFFNQLFFCLFIYNLILKGDHRSYGDCCKNPCPQNCLNGGCDAYTGHCRSCLSGYLGQLCTTGLFSFLHFTTISCYVRSSKKKIKFQYHIYSSRKKKKKLCII